MKRTCDSALPQAKRRRVEIIGAQVTKEFYDVDADRAHAEINFEFRTDYDEDDLKKIIINRSYPELNELVEKISAEINDWSAAEILEVKKPVTCPGCLEQQPNQLAHMGAGGCME